MAWTWRYENADGSVSEAAGDPGGFPTQSDAETYIGESWRELLDAGVCQVTLFDGERKIYGPMGLDTA